MTKSLERAIELIQQLPEDRQDLLARLMLHEIEEDEQWLRSTDTHSDKLTSLIDGILEDDCNGKCEPLNPDTL